MYVLSEDIPEEKVYTVALYPSISSIRASTSRSVARLLAMLMCLGFLESICPSESIIPWMMPSITSGGKRKSSYNSLSYLRYVRYRVKRTWHCLTLKSCTQYPSRRPFNVDLSKLVRVDEYTLAGLPVSISHCLANLPAKACEVTERRTRSIVESWCPTVPSLRVCGIAFVSLVIHPSPKTTPITYPKAYCFSGSNPSVSASEMTCSRGFSSRRFHFPVLPSSMRLMPLHFLQRGPLTLRCFWTPQSMHVCDFSMQEGQCFCRLRREVKGLPQSWHRGRMFIDKSPNKACLTSGDVTSIAPTSQFLPHHYTTDQLSKLVYGTFASCKREEVCYA